MTDNKQISLKLLYEVFKTRFPFSGIGLLFVILSIFVFLPIVMFLNSTKESYENYNYNNIVKEGKDATALITSIDTENNVTINNQFHPQIINYIFDNNGLKKDKFKTLSKSVLTNFKIGDSVNIKLYNGESVIINLEPYSFPYILLYLLPLIFLFVGIPNLLIGLFPTIKSYKLYKSGTKRNATILSITTTRITSLATLKQNVVVNYFYIGENGNKILGKSIVNGLNILTEKNVQDTIDIFVSTKDENVSCVVPIALL